MCVFSISNETGFLMSQSQGSFMNHENGNVMCGVHDAWDVFSVTENGLACVVPLGVLVSSNKEHRRIAFFLSFLF